jgi:hypothetical protein
MKRFLVILVSALTGATGGIYCGRTRALVPPIETTGAKPAAGRMHVQQLDRTTYALDFNGMMTVRDPDGMSDKRSVRIHLQADDSKRTGDFLEHGDLWFADVQGFITDDPEDEQ